MGNQASLFEQVQASAKAKPTQRIKIGVIAKRTNNGWVIWGDTYPHKETYKQAYDQVWFESTRSCWHVPLPELPDSIKATVTDWYTKPDFAEAQPSDELRARLDSIAEQHQVSANELLDILQSGALTQDTSQIAQLNGEVSHLRALIQELEDKLGASVTDILQAESEAPAPAPVDGLPEWFTPPSWWELITVYVQHRAGIAIVGPAGNGKTTTAEMALTASGMEYISISCTDRTEVVELVGGFMLTADGEQWRDGAVTTAFKNGWAVILDEADALDPRVMMSLQNALQDAGADGSARFINTPQGKVYPADKCPIVMCMNTFGDGADRQYNSRNKLDAASRDRLTYIATDYENEVNILKARGFNGFNARRIVERVQELRQRITDNALPVVISPRTMLNIAQAVETFGWSLDTAFEVECFGKIPPVYHDLLK